MPKPKLFLLDAHALCYRSFYAIRNLTTSKGQATNAVYGFLSTLKKILKDHAPEYVAVCFDSPKKTLRAEKFTQYKIHRQPMPDDLVSQIPLIKNVVEAYRLPIFQLDGYEADDLIATLAKRFGSDLDVVIVSDDKDMLQLLSDHVRVYSVRKDEVLGPKEAQEIWGIPPQHIVDFIALAGDQTDNIPGVVGIGEVTARNLINEFGTLEKILNNLERIKQEKVRQKLLDQRQMAELSKELAILDTQVPVPITLESMRVGAPDQPRLYELFKELEFRKFLEELPVPASAVSAQKVTVKRADSATDFKKMATAIKQCGRVALVLETETEPTLMGSQLFLSFDPTQVIILEETYWPKLSEILADPVILKITHDVKSLWRALEKQELNLNDAVLDIMLAAYLLAPAPTTFDLDAIVWDFLKESLPEEEKSAYAAARIFQLAPQLAEELKSKQLIKLFSDIEMPLAKTLFKMEQEGVKLDLPFLAAMSGETEVKIEGLIKKIYKAAGREFNLNSPKQLSEVLFLELKLSVVKKTKTGFSTDEEVLVKLASAHEVPALILEYRQLAKLKSTYIDALPKLVSPQDGRLHARFNQAGAETGRLSSSEPNLQNIPIRTELGRQIRRAFIPLETGHQLMSADYSQIELRILAHLSGDDNLKKAFASDQDIHAYTAAQVFDVKEKDVTAQMRTTAKRVNFGIIYGMGAFGLSKDLGISQTEAQDFIDRYFLRYPGVKKFMDESIQTAEAQGYVVTLLNRRRYLPEINSANVNLRQFAHRQAINTPVQGSAADMIKLAMINLDRAMVAKKFQSKMLITVHDELVFDVKPSEQSALINVVRQEMENAMTLQVPIKVSVKVGANWLEMKEIKP